MNPSCEKRAAGRPRASEVQSSGDATRCTNGTNILSSACVATACGYAAPRRRPVSQGEPRRGTVAARVLAFLQAGHSLTQNEALRLFGTSRLSATIFNLRKMGHVIETETIEVRCHDGRPTRVARYHLAMGRGP